MPAPSSEISTVRRSPSRKARSTIRPSAGLPLARRSPGASLPWSTEFQKLTLCLRQRLSQRRHPVEQVDLDADAPFRGKARPGLLLQTEGLLDLPWLQHALLDQDLADVARIALLLSVQSGFQRRSID